MKKFISQLLLILILVNAVGCGKKAPVQNPQEIVKDQENEKPLSVVLLISGNLGDMSFNDSAFAGVEKAKKELNVITRTVECNSVTEKFEPTLLDLAEEGHDIIIASSSFREYFMLHAENFPKTTFVLFDEEIDWTKGNYDNVYCIMYKNNEGSFLGGYLAGELTKSTAEGYNEQNVIGFLGGNESPIIKDFLVGYIEGAKYANPDIKVLTSYVSNFKDSARGKELSIPMINKGADITFNVAGGAGLGLIEASVAMKTKVLGVDSDQAMLYKDTKPEFSKAIPSSVLKNVGDTLFQAIEKYINNTLPLGKAEYLGVADGALGIADNEFYQAQVPEEIRLKIKDIEEKIKTGEIVVTSALNKSDEEINQIINSAK